MPVTRWLLCAVLALLVAVPGVAVAQETETDAPARPPGIPSSVSVVAGDANAVVTWVAPADDGGDTISSYTVTADPGGATASVPGVARTATVLGLINGMAYRFTVTAANSEGKGPPSAVSNVVRPAPAAGTAGPTLVSEDFTTSAGRMVPVSGGPWGSPAGGTCCRRPPTGAKPWRTPTWPWTTWS